MMTDNCPEKVSTESTQPMVIQAVEEVCFHGRLLRNGNLSAEAAEVVQTEVEVACFLGQLQRHGG